MNNDIKKKTIRMRIKKDKELMLDQLRRTPIVTVAAEKIGIARATYYRWRKADSKFANSADGAIAEGTLLINDMAESQLLSSIKDGNMTGIIFWLKHHHPTYETRVEIRASANLSDEKLDTKQNWTDNSLIYKGFPLQGKRWLQLLITALRTTQTSSSGLE